jgi:hypothetical protein
LEALFMGYESRLYIAEKPRRTFTEAKENGPWCYVSPIAMFDMCKCPSVAAAFNNAPKTDCYFYEADGNTRVLEDRYGDPLKEASIETVMNAVGRVIEAGNEYRRLLPLYSVLNILVQQKSIGVWDNLVVLHFGY